MRVYIVEEGEYHYGSSIKGVYEDVTHAIEHVKQLERKHKRNGCSDLYAHISMVDTKKPRKIEHLIRRSD